MSRLPAGRMLVAIPGWDLLHGALVGIGCAGRGGRAERQCPITARRKCARRRGLPGLRRAGEVRARPGIAFVLGLPTSLYAARSRSVGEVAGRAVLAASVTPVTAAASMVAVVLRSPETTGQVGGGVAALVVLELAVGVWRCGRTAIAQARRGDVPAGSPAALG